MNGQQRPDLKDCEVGDFVFYPEKDWEVGEFIEALDDDEIYWITMKSGEEWSFVLEDHEGEPPGFFLRRIEIATAAGEPASEE